MSEQTAAADQCMQVLGDTNIAHNSGDGRARESKDAAMSEKPIDRYLLRLDTPGSWSVIDTDTPANREDRIIYRWAKNGSGRSTTI
ncbi:hypothetical protein [Neorhizobium sp. DT-125]|uniref:hypothetical protein n=1 Tax=Neorhizobium sp. DT-125 TaxID=3396163 RepID=UPI003F1CA54F